MGTPIKHFVCHGAARSYAFKCPMLKLGRHASPIWNGRRIWSASRFCGISGEIYWGRFLPLWDQKASVKIARSADGLNG